MEGLRVRLVSGEGVGSIESACPLGAVERVVIPRAEVVLLGVNVELLTCVEKVRRRGIRIRCATWIAAQHHAIGIVGVVLKDSCAGVVNELPCRAVAVVEQILRSILISTFALAEDVITDDVTGARDFGFLAGDVLRLSLLEDLCVPGMVMRFSKSKIIA